VVLLCSVQLELWDHDDVGADDLIGSVQVSLEKLLAAQGALSFPLKRHGKAPKKEKPCTLTLRLLSPAPSTHKTVYLIRHGESRWNNAQSQHAVHKMVKECDHGLSTVGFTQAEDLARKILEAQQKLAEDIVEADGVKYAGGDADEEDEETKEVRQFLEARMVMSSPLTRAIQTCLIGLQHHPTLRANGVKLVKEAREVKNVGGMDSLGKAVGEEIRDRVLEELRTQYEPEKKREKKGKEEPMFYRRETTDVRADRAEKLLVHIEPNVSAREG
jgi:broad specificity phosphatase PhoE